MKLGKISPEKLQELVFPYIGKKRNEVLYNASLGRDCGIIDCMGDLIAVTCDPITGTTTHIGSFAVHVVANDLICAGAEPVGILVSIILPKHSDENQIKTIMNDVDNECQKLGIAILGGHTELSDAVNRTLIHCSGIGRVNRENIPDVKKIQFGDSIVITKGAGIEGTAILANIYDKELSARYGQGFTKKAQQFIYQLSVVPEGKIAMKHRPHCLHDATEGGLLGALWEVCAGQNLGFTIYEQPIFVPPETKIICNHYQLDPLKLISSGTLIIFLPNPDPLLEDLHQANITASCIGEVTQSQDKILTHTDGSTEMITTCPQDELWRITESPSYIPPFEKEGVRGDL